MQIENVADRIRRARKITGLNQEQFGREINVSKSAVSQWETGKTELAPVNLFAIEHRFGFRAEWIVTGKGPMRIEAIVEASSCSAQEDNLPIARRQALLSLFSGLTPEQQDDFLRDLEKTQRRNAEIFEALTWQRQRQQQSNG